MITQEQAILLAENKAQEDFPAYQSGPLLSAEHEDQCWYVHLRLYQRQQRIPLDVLYGVYLFNRSWLATLFDAAPAHTMSDDEQAMQYAAHQASRDFPAISILDVSIWGHDADRWDIEVYFCRLLDRSTAEASYAVWHDNGQFHARRVELSEISKGEVRRPLGRMHIHHHCTGAKPRKQKRRIP